MPRKTLGARPTGKPKTSADYVRQMRERLREAGLVKREFWVLPENVAALRGVEKALRQPFLGDRVKLEGFMTQDSNWTVNGLFNALAELELATTGEFAMQLLAGEQPSIEIKLSEYGGMPVYVAVAGDQVLVDATLIEAHKVKDRAAFNDLVLRNRDLFPLSSVGIEQVAGTEIYCMFGALSAASSLTVIVQEVHTLAENMVRAVEAFGDHFTA
ncbi:YjfI family protein [Pseudomonas typographi]|uniref:YjfI family protein n=1 Tax=Pseudomonas typographi TaxID=2715964 RepID=UPI0016879879|nr:YjfI family protein [Pseudomonas typographi]MBD1554619.1 YjfI family protein [Pseudomonas typographi]MBD1589736.1 YjfI family protein [Pseudomonas typographi]